MGKGSGAGPYDLGCEGIFELLRTANPWVDATLRWDPSEALEAGALSHAETPQQYIETAY